MLRKRDPDPDWVTDFTQYRRKGWHTSVALGNYIYIDGGEVFYYSNGSVVNEALNSTYSIPISESWSPQNVHFTRIDKGDFPSFNRENLWSSDNETLFAFNGDVSAATPLTASNQPRSAQLWQLIPDNSGSGTWQLFGVADNLVQSSAGPVTTANGSAYILGGIQDPRSSSSIVPGYTASADGLVTYNFASRSWENRSMSAFAPNGWSQEAQIYHLTGIANNQLLLAMGGLTSLPYPKQVGRTEVPYNTVSIYNIETQEWYNQSTTGATSSDDIPYGRGLTCHAGIQGDNGTYEIFIHGGARTTDPSLQRQANIDLDQVYALSIPSFSWHKAPYFASDARATHTCQIAGKRQMIAVGGIPPNLAPSLYNTDPWWQGVGVFDLSEMAWTDYFNAGAEPYTSPSQIKNYIAVNGSYPSRWNSNILEGLITGSVDNTSSGPSSTSSTVPASNGGAHSKSNVGAIAGGVVGGICGVILIVVIIWLLVRRRKRRQTRGKDGSFYDSGVPSGYSKAEMEADHRAKKPPRENEVPRTFPSVEMDARTSSNAEMDTSQDRGRQEMRGTDRQFELAG